MWVWPPSPRTQHAVFNLDQICDLGITASAVRQRVAAGRLHRIYNSVYSLVPRSLLSREGHWLAAVLACGPGAALSHRSAAALHELRGSWASRVDVTIPTRSGRRHEGIRIHRSTTLTEADMTTVNGIPCTTVARTLFDLADMISRRALERAFDQADVLDVFDLSAISDQLQRNFSRRAAKIVTALLNEHYIGSTPTWSELEEAFLALCRRYGLPQPGVNRWITLPDGGPAIRADFLFRKERIVVETDGHRYHNTAQAFERDRDRDQRLTVYGWRPFRTTWRQIMFHAAVVGSRLVALMTIAAQA